VAFVEKKIIVHELLNRNGRASLDESLWPQVYISSKTEEAAVGYTSRKKNIRERRKKKKTVYVDL
jgi:hypothetical protein